MKKIILAIGLMFGGVALVNAQDQRQDTTQTQSTEQQSDQYRSDTTTVDDNQHQEVTEEDRNSDASQSQQSDQYRTEGEGNVSDSTANDAASQTTTGTEGTTTESSTGTTDTESSTGTTGTMGQPTTDDQMSNDQYSMNQDKEGEQIELSELPAAVQTKLQGTDYQGWVVVNARKKMWSDPENAQAEAKEVYVIEAKNGSETKKLKFDKDGNEIEHDKHKKDDQK